MRTLFFKLPGFIRAISFLIFLMILISGSWAVATELPAGTPLYPPLEMGAISQHIPAGIRLRITSLSSLDSRVSNVGDIFIAQSSEDLWFGERLIIPRGTFVRGRVKEVQRPGYFSRGGLIRLAFDHVTLPSGDLLPLDLQLDTTSAKVSVEKNGLYTDPGIGSKLNSSVDKGVEQFKEFHDKGVKEGQKRGGGINMLLTVPTNTAAGVATGTAVTTANAVMSIFGKGESVVLKPGEELILDFYKEATLQAQ